MSTLNVALCDDELHWLAEGERIVRAYAGQMGIELTLEAYTSSEALLAASGPAPDVLFCDIELAGGESGIDLVRMVAGRWPRCQIVYVTNFLRYAPEVYVTEHLWFVLKERFAERLPEIMEKLERKMADDGRVLVVQTAARDTLSVPCPDVIYLERRGRTTFLRVRDGRTFEVPDRLPELLERLSARSFARCHASFAVNMGHIRLMRTGVLEMDDGSELPISRRFARGFRDRYLDWADDHAV